MTWEPFIDRQLFDGEDGLEKAKTFLDEAEKCLNHIDESNNKLKQQAYNILRVLIPLSIVTVGFIVSNLTFEQTKEQVFLMIVSIIYLGLLQYNTYFLKKALDLDGFYPVGNEPINILNETNLTVDFIEFLIRQCVTYQERIETATKINIKRSKFIQQAINTLYYSNICAVILGLIYLILSRVILFF